MMLTGKMLYHLVITDYLTDVGKARVLFDGRIQDIELDRGTVTVTAYGYYASLLDQPYATAFNTTADAIIKAVLTAVCPQINADQSGIAATDVTITSAADSSYLDIYPQELFEKLLAFSDSTNGKWDFAIWENRKAYLAKRNPTSIDWKVRLDDFVRFKLSHSLSDLYNSAYGIYQSGGSLTRTADANNTASQAKYGDGTNSFIRKKVVPDMGAVSATAAQAARDGLVNDAKEIKPRLSDVTLGEWVYDNGGVRYPSSWVRAGQVLRVRDLVPATGDLSSTALDAVRTFFIVETEYDAESKQNRLTFDTENTSLEALLAKTL
jgi:hypothetical protein